ncbi:MAG TPA: phytanoyl-CoA dioxygenase family protein [Fimbriimonadaceae bacterium]|nr:phytanoyl-CoA dioxygenase family protein [Fimbriimonadaceae bacterium]
MSTAPLALPPLDHSYPLTQEQVDAYARDGFVRLRGVCSPDEIRAYRQVIVEAAMRYNVEQRPMEERDTYGKAFLQIMNLWEVDEAARQFVFARRFAEIAARLMQVDAIRLYHDQALFKEPGGGHTPWHQDQFYWPLATDKTITMWMPLIDLSAEMGTMRFAPGSQQEGYLGPIPISDESERMFNEFLSSKGYSVTENVDMAAGDATFHSGWCLHGAPGNRTQTTREAMTIIYFEDGAKILEPDHPNRQADLDRWLPGGVPGEPAASTLNPVLWRRS